MGGEVSSDAVSTARVIRFAPFELDVRAAELRKFGVRLRLPGQSFRVLLLLLEHPGEVVLREEIRGKLWPNGTIVEFDHSINAAIKQIRGVLGDSAEDPRYIETVGRQGYRFIAQLDAHAQPPPVPAADPGGEKVSHFRALRTLGEGAMGKVCLAEDLKLGRQVALKFLADDPSATSPALLERFRREARAAAALSHPNICTVYGVEEHEGRPVIVMELVEGETLAARLERGALKLNEALALAIQIAGALAEAHSKGVVHRDLKPANIMIGKSGAKVLDFGLAKMERRGTEDQHTHTVTAEGTILGTVQYMSPEQAQGKEADARSDIFSFGLVLYEMVAGKRAFEGSSPASIIAAILEREPPVLQPEGLNRVVRACLAKDPGDRFQTAPDLKRAIEWISGGGETPLLQGSRGPGGARRLWLAWSVAAAATVGLAPIAVLHFREKPPAPVAIRFQFQFQAPKNASGGFSSLSPDDRMLAFFAGDRLWVHSMESGETRDLADSDGGVPFWSPDSRFIGYTSQKKVMRIEATGGLPQTVASCEKWGAGAWNQDGVIVFADASEGLFRVPALGGVRLPITALDPARQENMHFGPSFLPDRRHFVYSRHSTDEKKDAIYLGSVDAKPGQQSSKPLLASKWQAMYVPSADAGTAYLLFVRERTLMAQPFDNRRMELKGQAQPVAEGLADDNSGNGGWAGFSATAHDLVFQEDRVLDRQLTWYDREGKVLGTLGQPGDYQASALSPNGKWLAVSTKNRQGADIWLLDLSRDGASTRFTFGSAINTDPVWSPDGSHIVFSSNRDGWFNLYQKPANGVTEEEVLLKSDRNKHPTSWSRDGRFLLYTVGEPKTMNDLWLLHLDHDMKAVPFLATEFDERQARFSPDGHWVAYTSNESGHAEVYVRPFSMNSAGTAVEAGGRWLISSGSASTPRWRGDGRELYYRSGNGGIMAVEIATTPAFRVGKPQPLGIAYFGPGGWDVTADGKRFLGLSANGGPQPFTVVLNWQAGLKK